jgi:hypothetical protein
MVSANVVKLGSQQDEGKHVVDFPSITKDFHRGAKSFEVRDMIIKELSRVLSPKFTLCFIRG